MLARARRGDDRTGRSLAWLCALALCAQAHPAVRAAVPPAGEDRPDDVLARVDRLEELLLQLTPELHALDVSALNLALPDEQSRRLFDATVTWTDIAPAPLPSYDATALLAAVQLWPIASAPRTEPTPAMRLWRPFLDGVDYFSFAHFKLYRGRFLDAAESVYVGDVRFDANARLSSGPRATVEAKMEVEWRKAAGGKDGAAWRIRRWHTRSFTVTQTARPLFAEVLEEALPDRDALRRARQSLHEQMVIAHLRDPKAPKPHEYFQFQSLNRHPGLAVADVDRDGHDDLYVMERQGTNLLLRNRGDGTFEEIAERLGLDVTDHTSCALFADFDNDGDLDVFLGRTLARELSRRGTGRTLYILDEPTTGLHFEDTRKLLDVLNKLVEQGNTVVVIEHNLDVIRCADHLIDLGPEGGAGGGRVIVSGTPEVVAADPQSATGQFLAPLFGTRILDDNGSFDFAQDKPEPRASEKRSVVK